MKKPAKKIRKQEDTNPHLAAIIERNIETLLELRSQMERNRSPQDRVADLITRFSGSNVFLYCHIAWFGAWLALNLGWVGTKAFDPYPFGLLTMIVSLEAIFLSTFVLISQNRMAAMSDERADLDLQINLLSEYEITKILKLTDAIADHLGLKQGKDSELKELERTVPPDALLREMQKCKTRSPDLLDPKARVSGA